VNFRRWGVHSVGRWLPHVYTCKKPICKPCYTLSYCSTRLKKIAGSTQFKPSSNLNLAVLHVQFSVLAVLHPLFGSGSQFRQIPDRTRPN
jgi:hypothetical protein